MRVLVVSGPTREYIDDVRFISNASSGKMGVELVRAALARGHKVTVVAGPTSAKYPPQAKAFPVETTAQMLEVSAREFKKCDCLVMAAAVCDFRPVRRVKGKIARTKGGLALQLMRNPDIVRRLSLSKSKGQTLAGFALESKMDLRRALDKMRVKKLDLIVMNPVSAIGADAGDAVMLARSGAVVSVTEFVGTPKRRIASAMIVELEDMRRAGGRLMEE